MTAVYSIVIRFGDHLPLAEHHVCCQYLLTSGCLFPLKIENPGFGWTKNVVSIGPTPNTRRGGSQCEDNTLSRCLNFSRARIPVDGKQMPDENMTVHTLYPTIDTDGRFP